jgi:hypothetical protein
MHKAPSSISSTKIKKRKKRNFGHRNVQREEQIKTKRENDHPQAKERNLRRTPPCTYLYPRLSISSTYGQ